MEPLHHDPRGWTLYRADYRDTLAEVARAGGADLIAFSPPYCDARTYGMNVSWDHADYAALGDAVFGALKPGGHALVNVDAPVREWRPGFGTERGFHPWRMMLDWAERVGFRVPDRLAFGRMGLPGAYGGRFRNDWEPLIWLQRPGAVGYFDRSPLQKDSAGGPYVGGTNRSASRDGWVDDVWAGDCAERGVTNRGTLWDYGPMGNGHTGAPDIEAQDHPARWPYRLARDIVVCFCPPGGLVVDPFVGAGTTAAAAVGEGRRFIGGDLGQRDRDGMPWATVAHGVLTERNRQVSLFGGAG
jgi:site-specific DNA-methyltransferase (adenine-specific)